MNARLNGHRSLSLLTAIALPVLGATSASAALIASQGFEAGGDTWTFTPSPAPFNAGGDTWDAVTALTGSTIVPQSGVQFWGGRDVSGGSGASEFIVTFDPIDISLYEDVSISFFYNAENFDTGDTLFYRVDTGSGFGADVPVFTSNSSAGGGQSTPGWVEAVIPVDDSASTAALVIGVTPFSGSSDYSGFDTVTINGTLIPEPASLALVLGAGLMVLGRGRRA